MATSYETIAKALFIHYESLYDVDIDTGAYYCFHESESYEKYGLEKRGDDFYRELQKVVSRVIIPEDREYVLNMLSAEALREGTANGQSYSFVYRVYGEEEPAYHKIRAKQEKVNGRIHIYLGVRDIDSLIRQERAHSEEVAELERKLQLSRIRNFTGQMQPHFLYNALGSIQEIILEDPNYAFELIGDFTTYLRGCIRSMANDRPVSFSQELENIHAYVNIEKMRFGDKLDVVFDIHSSGFEILPLSIQPLVENAIRHGIYQKGKEGGRVIIRSCEDDNRCIVQIEDNGEGFDVAKWQEEMLYGLSESTGLKNLTFRLKNVLDADVDIYSTIGVGTIVTVSIPKVKPASVPKAKGGGGDEDNHSRR